MFDDVHWIASEDGPLLLLPLHKQEQWWNVFGQSNRDKSLWFSASDQADGGLENYVKPFVFDGAAALAFGAEQVATTTWRAGMNVRYFAQVSHCEDFYALINILRQQNFPEQWEQRCLFSVSDAELVLFDFRHRGADLLDWGWYLSMPIGVYRFEHCVYTPTAQIKVNLYRMVLVAA
jgi:hypothetical protein